MAVGLHIGVSILSGCQRDLANRFAQRADAGGYPDVATEPVDEGAPVLASALASLSAHVTAIAPAGENIMLLCEERSARATLGGEPLLYFDGRYFGPQSPHDLQKAV